MVAALGSKPALTADTLLQRTETYTSESAMFKGAVGGLPVGVPGGYFFFIIFLVGSSLCPMVPVVPFSATRYVRTESVARLFRRTR